MQSQLQLPIAQHKKHILDLLAQNRALIISGKTGCGKSTQVPQYILSNCANANIAVCQPRRLAAIALAKRVSQQMNIQIGVQVGYQIGMDSKINNDRTKIRFMTYGILIQELLFNHTINYTHIILDQVHERTLQMDFTFIALRKLLDQPKMKNTKLVIMSATINSSQFKKYFSIDTATKQFTKPTITYSYAKDQDTGGGRRNTRNRHRNNDNNRNKLQVQITTNLQNSTQCQAIQLPDKNKYKIKQYYADQFCKLNRFKNNKNLRKNEWVPSYVHDDDVRISQSTYGLAVDIVDQVRKSGYNGSNNNMSEDILVFVPGMQEIKTLKNMLEKDLGISSQSIIQVHSAYSQNLYERLFSHQIKNKIIIATNIGQSSITLPYCKVVIDFCLNRKNMTLKAKGITSFETRIASKANLLQRAGRVGRTSDGQVYRLISKNQYNQLSDFDIPQIKCVSLQMVILRAKQIDKTCNSTLFQDPYDVFLNAIQPPKVAQIHDAIKYLVEQETLTYKDQTKQNNNKFIGEKLKLTRIGEFMVSMPCSIRISKMIILSIQFGITYTMLGIAAILMSQKKFFQSEDKIDNIEQFMHSIIGYDRGQYNDFLLRHRMFVHWKQKFYNLPKKLKPKQADQVLQEFCSSRISSEQRKWCSLKGVTPNTLRDILRIFQDLKSRLFKIGIKVQKDKVTQNQLVIFCLSMAFEDTTCHIEWKKRITVNKKQPIDNMVSIVQSKQTTVQNIQDYTDPQQYPNIQFVDGGFVRVKGTCGVMSKFLLPINYTKANPYKTSPLFKYLSSNPPKVSYTYQPAQITQKVKQIHILNTSINKVNIRLNHNQQYMLVAQSIFASKGRYYVGECALIQSKLLILIKMMTVKKVEIQLHVSQEFYYRVVVGQDVFQLPFFLGNDDLELILDIREFALWEKNRTIQENKSENQSKNKVLALLHRMTPKPMTETWHYIFNQIFTNKNFISYEPQPIRICKQLKCKQVSYFKQYKKWKLKQHRDLYYNFRIMTIKKCSLICSTCWPNQITVVDDLSVFDCYKGLLPLNEYRGSFKIQKSKLNCIKGHNIGHVINKDEAQLQNQQVMMYGPFQRSCKFMGDQQSIGNFLKLEAEGIKKLQRQQKQISQFQCIICATYNDHEGVRKYLQHRMNSSDKQNKQFWRKIQKHMYSSKHCENVERFVLKI